MQSRCRAAATWVSLIAAGVSSDAVAQTGLPPRPNIIHILADDLGYGSVGFNLAPGDPVYVKTPHLNSLAAGGMRMTAGYCPSALCAPTRASLLTGMHNGHTLVDRNGIGIDTGFRNEDVTVAEMLKIAGYQTGIVGKWGFGGSDPGGPDTVTQPASLPNNQGYDFFYGYLNHSRAHNYFSPTLWRTNAGSPNGVQTVNTNGTYTHDLFEQQAVQYVAANANADQPFYLQFNPTIPHSDLDQIAQVPNWDAEYRNEPSSVYGPADSQRRKYAAMVTRMDASIGRLLAKLNDPNGDGNTVDSVADNTLIVFTSDNGPATDDGAPYNLFNLNGPYKGGKRDLYEGGVRVPMALRWADQVVGGSVTDRVIDQADFLPTVAELAGVESPVGVDGVSFAPLLTGQGVLRDRPHLIFEHHEQPGPAGQEAGESGARWAVRRGDFKLIRFADGTSKLYNLATNPAETVNLASSNPGLVAELEAIAVAEHAAEDFGYAVTYRTWTAVQSNVRVANGNNWSGSGAPADNWSAVVENVQSGDRSAYVDANVTFLGFGVRGGTGAAGPTQTVVVNSGFTLTGVNEVRVSHNGLLELQSGATVASSRWVDIRAGGTLLGSGAVVGDLYNAGRVSLGREGTSSPFGRMTVAGDYLQSASGRLQIEVGGPPVGTAYDALTVTGAATLAGKLDLSSVNGYTPAATDAFDLLAAGSRSGRFDPLELTAAGPGRSFSLHYGPDRVMALAGEWASPNDIGGEFDVPGDLLVSGDWHWSGLLVKHGAGTVTLDLTGDFTTAADASLAIVGGTLQLGEGGTGTLVLSGFSFGDLGQLTGDPSLSGIDGIYYSDVSAVPEPAAAVVLLPLLALARRRRRSPRTIP